MEPRTDKFTFFKSYFQAIEHLNDEKDKFEFLIAVLRYAFFGEEPSFSDKLAGMFELLKPNIDKSISNIKRGKQNGSKGGAPLGNQNAKKETTQGLNENKLDKDKDREKDMEYGQAYSIGASGKETTTGEPNINFDKIYS